MQEKLPGTKLELQPLSQDLNKLMLLEAENGSKSQLLIWNGSGTAQETGISLKAVLERTGCCCSGTDRLRALERAADLERSPRDQLEQEAPDAGQETGLSQPRPCCRTLISMMFSL
jgi:hypothetical protein